MKPEGNLHELPENVAQKLRTIRRRGTTFRFLEGTLLTLAVLVGATLGAMIVDYAAGWFDSRMRYLMTLAALSATGVAFALWLVRPLLRGRSIVATAQEIDRNLPQLEERWSTVTELSQSKDAPGVRGSEAMIHQVGVEAESVEAAIQPEMIVPTRSVFRAGCWLLGAVGAMAVLFAASFTQGKLLLQRFWMPGAAISLTQVSASPADGWVPKGESLPIIAKVSGRVPHGPATLFIRPQGGKEIRMSMMPKTGAPGQFQHAIEAVSDSFQYRVRAGDGQTPWHEITAADRPKISEVKLRITPPSYSGLPIDEKPELPHAVRMLEGGEIAVSFRSDQPLERMILDLGEGQTLALKAEKDHWYHFQSRPTNSFSFTAAAFNRFQLENKLKPSCSVTVYEDLPPSVKILEPSDDVAVAPGEKVDVTFEASDDLGLAKAEIIVATTTALGATNQFTVPVELASNSDSKQVRETVSLDPSAFGLKHGDQLSYVVQVTDTRQKLAQAGVESTASAGAPPKSDDSPPEPKSEKSEQLAQNPESASEQDTKNSASAKADGSKKSLAKAGENNPSEQRPPGSQPPPNAMSMRSLDAGQCTACQPRNIKVDEWAGSFDGEKRKKLEIAIEPVLQRLDELLVKAQLKTGELQQAAASPPGLQASHREPLEAAKAPLGEATEAIGELRSRTTGTPYAFIGLQLYNIGEAHITPARSSLGRVELTSAAATIDTQQLDKAAFHIGRAREMLADLTKTYQSVKRDQEIADAMQRLSKMYQIFLEDTQALLGSSQGPINAFNRKVAEVDDAFVEKLKALLEEKKKIMAELAKVLAEDPRLLRRYLAMLELQSTNYRDQMTLLAVRQKELHEQVQEWNATPEADRATVIAKLRQRLAEQHRDVVEAATKLRDNMETWLPLDVRADQEQVQAALARAERIAMLTAESAKPGGTSGEKALTELRALHEALPEFGRLAVTNQGKMDAYIANRLPEIEALITAQSGRLKIVESLDRGDFSKVGEIVQHRITQDTVTLGEKLEATESQVASMSDEIAEKAAALNKIVQTDVIEPQKVSVDQLAKREVKPAGETLAAVVPAFAVAEQTFDELMRLIIAKLDEAAPPQSPGEGGQDLDSLLAMLEDEMKAAEGLGIPCRPINVSIMRDWMRPGSNSGQGMGQAQAQARAAQSQAKAAQTEAERLEKEARESARQAMAKASAEGGTSDLADGAAQPRTEAWNKLASRLQKDLLQGRDNTPPEQYRDAIANYFKTISERPVAVQR